MSIAPTQVLQARKLMRKGFSMQFAAISLGVRSSDLDLEMWRSISTEDRDLEPYRPHRIYAGDFD